MSCKHCVNVNMCDCVDMFIERPKSLSAQAATWSGYKHHNTFKFLVGIRPTGFYFVSFFFFMGAGQEASLSPKIVGFIIYWKGMMK